MELLASPSASSPHPAPVPSPPPSSPGPLHTQRPETDRLIALTLDLRTWEVAGPGAGAGLRGLPAPPAPGLEHVLLMHRQGDGPGRPQLCLCLLTGGELRLTGLRNQPRVTQPGGCGSRIQALRLSDPKASDLPSVCKGQILSHPSPAPAPAPGLQGPWEEDLGELTLRA